MSDVTAFKHAFLVLANLAVSLVVTQAAGGAMFGIALVILFNLPNRPESDVAGYVVLLAGLVATVASFLISSWIFATKFARDDRRGHLAVVWGIPAIAIIAFLTWFIGTAPRQ